MSLRARARVTCSWDSAKEGEKTLPSCHPVTLGPPGMPSGAGGGQVDCMGCACEEQEGGAVTCMSQSGGGSAASPDALASPAQGLYGYIMGDRVARLSAVDCVKSPFFVLLESASKKVTCTCMLCEINGEEDAVERDQVKRDGRVMCFKYPQQCRSPDLGSKILQHIFRHFVFQMYSAARSSLIETQIKTQLEAEMKEQLEAKLAQMRAMDEHGGKVFAGGKRIIA